MVKPDFSRVGYFGLGIAALLLLGFGAAGVQAQTACSSDSQPRPTALLERFINADCVSCWSSPTTPAAGAGQVALDWVLPGSQGIDAPLAAVARIDSQSRWSALLKKEGKSPALPARTAERITSVVALGSTAFPLRVAHGGAQADYIGASIGMASLPRNTALASGEKPWVAFLALIEELPAGTEGSQVSRNLVRNLLQAPVYLHKQLSKKEQTPPLTGWLETRSMNIPAGANPERLRVVGWLEDNQGRIRAAAQSRCIPG